MRPTREAELLDSSIKCQSPHRPQGRGESEWRWPTKEERGLEEQLLGEGADVARGVECGRQALDQPPLMADAVPPAAIGTAGAAQGWGSAQRSARTPAPLGFEMGSRGEAGTGAGGGGERGRLDSSRGGRQGRCEKNSRGDGPREDGIREWARRSCWADPTCQPGSFAF